MKNEDPFDDMPVIYSYTRAQAIEDGVLVDLAEWAKETGFKYPVACTAEVWHSYVTPPECTREFGQSERGRAHDLLWMLFLCIQGSRKTADNDLLQFEVLFLKAPNRSETVSLKALCGPGDDGEPVITIMLPHED